MGFTEQDAIETIKSLLEFNDYDKIKKILQSINPEVFTNKLVRDKFKEILLNLYNSENINYLKNLLNDFIKEYDKYKAEYHFWYCSKEFREKFKRKDFRNSMEIKRFREIILRIIEAGKKYSTEDIGEFFVSPQGHEKYRITWFIKDNAIYLCEQFHHDKEYESFCNNARFRRIVRKSYSDWDNLEDFTPLNLKAA